MTGFGSLYYTDCRPGQGLQEVAGFQFQAATPGLALSAMALVQRTALYEPPSSWMRDRRPVADYPASLAHTADDDFYVTAAGCYLGQEANGQREGNQFTHAVVTRDVTDYALLRPAQLWGADWWATGPAATKELDPLPEEPEPGPLAPETVRDRVNAVPDGPERLTALLSAIQHRSDPERRRTIVLVTADPGEAACWIAAATLLLPAPQAFRTGFKIFVADAQYGQHDIIALHPDWAGRWADTGPASGLAVFELDRSRHSTVETTPAAAFWVPRFLRSEDVHDVIGAVELSGQFARSRPDAADTAEPSHADRLAAVAVATGEGPGTAAEIDTMATWLLDAPPEAVEIAGDDVLEAVLAAEPRSDALRTLAEATGSRGWTVQTARIHRGLLAAEVREVLAAPDGATALGAVRAWPPLRMIDRLPDEEDAARSEIESALRTAPEEHVPALLTVASRHGLRVVIGNVHKAMYDFAAWWLQADAPELEFGAWPAPPEAIDWVRDLLRSWLQSHRSVAIDVIRARWWHPLRAYAVDPADELDATVLSAGYAALRGTERERLVTEVQRLAAQRERSESAASVLAWRVLFAERVPSTTEASGFVTRWLGPGREIAYEVLSQAVKVIERERELSAEALALIARMGELGFPLPPRLADVQARDNAVGHVVDALGELRAGSGDAAGMAGALNAADVSTLETRIRELVDALVAAPTDVAIAVVAGCRRHATSPILHELERRWPTPDARPTREDLRAARLSFVLAAGDGRDIEQRRQLAHHLNRLADAIGLVGRDVRRGIARLLPPEPDVERWEQWLREIEPRKLKRGLNVVTQAVLGVAASKKDD
jgi:hypothetical protein